MLNDVPAPAWKTSTTNWSRSFPARTSLHAAIMAFPIFASSHPTSMLAVAAAFFMRTYALMIWVGAFSPLIGKFSVALSVCMPK